MQVSNLLSKAIWTNQDIMDYLGCGKTVASRIHREAVIKYGGYIELCPRKVRRDAVLKVLGVSFTEEAYKINYLKGDRK